MSSLWIKRDSGQEVTILTTEGEITIKVRIANRKANLIFNAPQSVRIYRTELLEGGIIEKTE